MPNFQFNFDRVSFWLGFIAASLLWWFIFRIRGMFPVWGEEIREAIRSFSERNLSGIDDYLRRETLQRAQALHLAAPLFSLDEILIEPRLLVPPGGQDPTVIPPPQSIAGQNLPYLPDWPELTASFGPPSMTTAQALNSGRHLAIIGQPGSGKSVALAALASQLARRDPQLGKYVAAVPMFVHALELDPTLEEGKDPLLNLIKTVSGHASVVMQPQIPRFLNAVFKDKTRKLVLLLDGLDELTGDQSAALIQYLTALLRAHPRLQIITTASSDYLDGLTKLHFYPLGLLAWSQPQRVDFARKWGELWSKQLVPEITKKQGPVEGINPTLFEQWLSTETAYVSPLEWTLRLWGAYAGDLGGNNPMAILDSYITRFLPSPVYISALEEIAHQMVLKPGASMRFEEMELILSQFQAPQMEQMALEAEPEAQPAAAASAAVEAEAAAAAEAEAKAGAEADAAVHSGPAFDDPVLQGEAAAQPAEAAQKAGEKSKTAPKKKAPKKKTNQSRGEQILTRLLQSGVLIEQADHQVRFSSPVFLGFLAGMKTTEQEAAEMAEAVANKLDWPLYPLVLHYTAVCNDNPEWVFTLTADPTGPMFRNLLIAARWLRDAPLKAEWRQHIMRLLVNFLQDETLPLGVRARLIAAFYLSRDPSTPKLFKQLLLTKSSTLRKAALLGSGALCSPQLINDILGMLVDSDPSVRNTACLALAAIPVEAALNAVVEILISGDEAIRQAAAEALAQIKPDGHKVLEEAATVDDLLTRRAAVFGLMQIHEPWALKVLEKIAVEDAQWVVRNAAGQALEAAQETAPLVPKSLPKPSESPWLLTFASKMGMGITPGQPATEVLTAVLRNGSTEEQIAALHYLRDQADEGAFREIYNLLYSNIEELQEPILHTLWWCSISGNKLPSPTQFGLG